MKKPKVFVNSINKNIKNNKESYHFRGEIEEVEIIDESVDVTGKISDIFNSDSFVYKSSVIILLKDGTKLKEEVIAVRASELITLSDKKIKISDIKDIKKAN